MIPLPEMGEIHDPTAESREHARVLGRIRKFSLWGYGAFVVIVAITMDWKALAGLTCGAVVVMINFLWLEEIVVRLLQPAPQVKAWRLVVRTLARFALFGVALSVAIFVARFNAIGVLLGFSIVVIGIMGEAVYGLFHPDPGA